MQKEVNVCKRQEGYLWSKRGVTTLLVKTLKNIKRNGISEKLIRLVNHEQDH